MATKTRSDKDSSADHSPAPATEEAAEHLQAARTELKNAADAGRQAAVEAQAAAGAEAEVLLGKGRDLLCEAQTLIRQHPVAAFGVAFAAGWLLSRVGRR